MIGIISIIAGIGTMNGRRIADRERAHGAVSTLQQSIWQGATSAAARGLVVDLEYDASDLTLRDAESDEVLRTFDLPPSITTNLPEGVALTFLPPGKVDQGSAALALSEPLYLDTGDRRYSLEISLIGGVRIGASE